MYLSARREYQAVGICIAARAASAHAGGAVVYGEPRTFLASAVVKRGRGARGHAPTRYARAGWQSDVIVDHLPVGESAIHAWAYDHVVRRFVRLDGEVKVRRAPD